MNRDKQIEKMANDIAKICPDLVENCCGQINCVTHLTLSLSKIGYRKAEDVAREIFEEIEEVLNMQTIIVCQTIHTAMTADEPCLPYLHLLEGRSYSLNVVEEHIAELKKKYTEGEG